MNGSAEGAERFGGFALGSLQLALPMSALREVMPCNELADLPCMAACVIGGISLRGVLVPVVDLRIALGRPARPAEYPSVVLMVHAGKILGLLADGVTGIFDIPPGRMNASSASSVSEPGDAIFLGGAIRPDSQTMVAVLSPSALSQLRHVPMVDDPEPARQQLVADLHDAAFVDTSVPMVLLRCGNMPLAVEAALVHSTLAAPAVRASALSGGHCRGVIDCGTATIPAIDLQSLCGVGRLDMDEEVQAFIVALPAGQVAFLISSVVDVVRAQPDDVKRIPAFALPQPRLFCGALPLSTLPPDVAERSGASAGQYFIVSTPGLSSCEDVVALSGMNTERSVETPSANVAAGLPHAHLHRRTLVTYMLKTEQASLLEQVSEILGYEPATALFPSDGPLLGFMVNRGRSIPVLSLSRVLGVAGGMLTGDSSVLVVESDSELIGFAVTALGSIEQALWEPAVPEFQHAERAASRMGQAAARPLALVGEGEAERMLDLIDLHQLARELQMSAIAA